MTSFDIIKNFFEIELLNQKEIKELKLDEELKRGLNKLEKFINKNIVFDEENLNKIDLQKIKRIFIDLYDVNKKNATELSNFLKNNSYLSGAKEREKLKKFLDYRNSKVLEDIPNFNKKILNMILNYIEVNNITEDIQYIKAKKIFFEQLLEQKNKIKENKINEEIFDKLLAIYSAVLQHNELKKEEEILLLYKENKKEIIELLGIKFAKKFYYELKKENIKGSRKRIASEFSKLYIKIRQEKYQEEERIKKLELSKESNQIEKISNLESEDYECIYFNINQEFYHKYNDYEYFINIILNMLNELDRILKNHRMLVIKIADIFIENRNIKWDIYSKLTIYGENFKREKLGRYYVPEKLFLDYLKHKYPKFNFLENINERLEELYKNNDNIKLEEFLKEYFPEKDIFEIQNIFKNYKKAYVGFTYIDTFILNKEKKYKNEIMEYDNSNELLLIFEKNRIDGTKIPCPSCGSFNVSGNSFPKVGVRSWECKNLLCPDRSKSNRGKRYSERTILMQYGYENSLDVINKELISFWRKDVTFLNNDLQIVEMITNYYTFSNEKILLINSDSNEKKYIEQKGRLAEVINLSGNKNKIKNLFREFFIEESNFLQNIFFNKVREQNEYKTLENFSETMIINGDCLDYFKADKSKSIKGMVTSPPYYNAREYSNWNNIYLYLNDMFSIVKAAKNALSDKGVFLYNIGDISGNPNNVVYSKMGEKKIPLGAYTILLFEKAGYELVENYIWFKKEPQSQRHKNDGKFTPLYQNPMNTYEHLFIFKKKDAKLEINLKNFENLGLKWIKNTIVEIEPVRKINSKKENILGHTAPFPWEIPNFLIKIFTEKGEKVLDPFLGSGTTLIEAKKLNRKGIGIELSEEYTKLVEERLNKLENVLSIAYENKF